ncbi:hypothetical protein OFD71_40765, partial [Escherichia coli]|nr:hypothetical protein [Escherichia coli]
TASYTEQEAPPPSGGVTTQSINNGKTWTAIVSGSGLLGGVWNNNPSDSCGNDSECSKSGIDKKTGSVSFTLSDGQTFVILKP